MNLSGLSELAASLTLPASLPSIWPVGVLVIVGALIGARRGWIQEVAGLGMLLLLWTLVGYLGVSLVEMANRAWLIARFTWVGGFDLADPLPLLVSLRASPAIDLFAPQGFLAVVFAAGVLLSYIGASQIGPRATTPVEAVLGALIGAISGYLVAYIGMGFIASGIEAVGRLNQVTIILALAATGLAVAIGVGATWLINRTAGDAGDSEPAESAY